MNITVTKRNLREGASDTAVDEIVKEVVNDGEVKTTPELVSKEDTSYEEIYKALIRKLANDVQQELNLQKPETKSEEVQQESVIGSLIDDNTAEIRDLADEIRDSVEDLGGDAPVCILSESDDDSLAIRWLKKIYKETTDDPTFFKALLLVGHCGVAKTESVKQFCKEANLNLCKIDCSSLTIETVVGISKVVERTDGNLAQALVSSPLWDRLDDKTIKQRSVLFLDEFNHMPEKLMNQLNTLFTEHRLTATDASGKAYERAFPKLLFIVAAINPAGRGYLNNTQLTPSWESRFWNRVDVVESKDEFKKFQSRLCDEKIKEQSESNTDDERVWANIQRWVGLKAINNAIMQNHSPFNFDSDDEKNMIHLYKERLAGSSFSEMRKRLSTMPMEAKGLDNESLPRQYTADMLQGVVETNYRAMDDFLRMNQSGTKKDMLYAIKNYCSFLAPRKEELEQILNGYTDPPIFAYKSYDEYMKAKEDGTLPKTTQTGHAGLDDFDNGDSNEL